MTLKEAIESGKPFCRESWGTSKEWVRDNYEKGFFKDEILATDWILKYDCDYCNDTGILLSMRAKLAGELGDTEPCPKCSAPKQKEDVSFRFINNCDQSAIKALRYIVRNKRPAEGGEQTFNTMHLEQIAMELEASLKLLKDTQNHKEEPKYKCETCKDTTAVFYPEGSLSTIPCPDCLPKSTPPKMKKITVYRPIIDDKVGFYLRTTCWSQDKEHWGDVKNIVGWDEDVIEVLDEEAK